MDGSNTSQNRELSAGDAASDLLTFIGKKRFSTVLADPPWRFTNRTGKMAPEHRRLSRYGTMTATDIAALPVSRVLSSTAHLYLWVPNALLPEGLQVMSAWGFQYKTNIIWHKLRKDGGSDGRGVGFYFGTLPKFYFLVFVGRTLARSNLGELRSTIWEHGNANTRVSRMSNTISSKLAVLAHSWSYLLVELDLLDGLGESGQRRLST